MKQLSSEIKARIEAKIASLEQHTSCEFVCIFRKRSLGYPKWLLPLVPRKALLEQIEVDAHLAFLHEEVFATRDRNGIMIFISEYERGVYVMADKGVTAKIPSSEFGELGQMLAKDFSQKQPENTFLNALDQIAKKLGQHFPPRKDDQNELSNQVR